LQNKWFPYLRSPIPNNKSKWFWIKFWRLRLSKVLAKAPVEQMEPEEIEALDALERNDFKAAETAYKKWLARKPSESLAKLGLAQTQLMMRTAGLQINDVIAEATSDPTNIQLQIKASDVEIVNGDVEAAFTRLLHAVRITSGTDRDTVKNHLLELFALVEPTDPRSIAAQKSSLVRSFNEKPQHR
jgi:putative thioredoxin